MRRNPSELVLEAALRHHEPRRWIERSWREWLAPPRGERNRVLRIVGRGGSGKTVFAAWAVRERPGRVAAVFCGPDALEGVVDGATAVERLAASLRETLASDGFPQEVSASGTCQNPSCAERFEDLVVAPLRRFDAALPEDAELRLQGVVLLIDALEDLVDTEGGYALAACIRRMAPSLPSWVRIALAGRDASPLDDLFAGCPLLRLDDPARREEDESRMDAYVRHRLAHTSGLDPDVAAPRLLEACRGDWRAADALCSDLEGAPGPSLPEGFLYEVPGAYRAWCVQRIERIDSVAWSERLAPVLEVLLAARGDVSFDALRLLGIDSQRAQLPRLAAGMLETHRGADGEGPRLAHPWVGLWLKRSGRIDPAAGHRRFAEAARSKGLFADDLWWHLGRIGDARALHEYLTDPVAFASMYRRRRSDFDEAWRVLDALPGTGITGKDLLAERIEDQVERDRRAGVVPDPMLLGSLAGLWMERRLWGKARDCADEALLRLPASADPLDRAWLLDLAGDAMIQGRIDDDDPRVGMGAEAQRKALGIRAATGVDTPDLADSLNNAGHLAALRGDYDEAERRYRAGLELRLRILPDDAHPIAESHQNLGFVASRRCDFVEAETRFEEALRILAHHPVGTGCEISARLNLRGILDKSTGRSIDVVRESFLILLAAVGACGTLDSFARTQALAVVDGCAETGLAADREGVLETARRWLPKTISVQSPHWLLFRMLLLRWFDERDAEPWECLLRDVRRWHRPDSTLAAEVSTGLSAIVAGSDLERALALHERALEAWRVHLPDSHPLVMTSLRSLLHQWVVSSRRDRFAEYDRVVRAHGRQIDEPSSMEVRRSKEWFELLFLDMLVERERSADKTGMARVARRIVAEAEPYLCEESWMHPEGDRRLAIAAVAHNELGYQLHLAAGDLEEAELEFVSASRLSEQNMPEGDADRANIRLNLELVRHRAGKPVDVALVRSLGGLLEEAGDFRLWKAAEILSGAGQELASEADA